MRVDFSIIIKSILINSGCMGWSLKPGSRNVPLCARLPLVIHVGIDLSSIPTAHIASAIYVYCEPGFGI